MRERNPAPSSVLRELIERDLESDARGETIRKTILDQGAAAVEPLIDALDDEGAPIRAIAFRLLGEIGDRRAVESIIRRLRDPDRWKSEPLPTLYDRIVWSILPGLRKLRADLETGQRSLDLRHGAGALGMLGDPRARDLLEELAQDADEAVSAAARAALERITRD